MIEAGIQMTLPLGERRSSADRAREDAAELVAFLDARPALLGRPAADLGAALGWNDRRLRAAAEASDGEILSAPGCTGYRLARSTPVDDYLANERARYRSQITMMTARMLAMDKAVHCAKRRRA